MLRKVAVVWFLMVLVIGISSRVLAQADAKKDGRVEGRVTHVDSDKHTLTVLVSDQSGKKTITYDASTKWEAAFHAKNPTTIEAKDVIVGDQVICQGATDEKGNMKATLISKRLSHPNP